MARTLDEYMAKRPGRPDVQARHKERMLAEMRAFALRGHEIDDHGAERRGGEAGD